MMFINIVFVLLFIMYNFLMFTYFGRLWSISAGYYKLQKLGAGWMFTFLLFIIVAYLTALTVYTESWLFFIAAIGAAFTGVATMYKRKIVKEIHYIGSGLMVLAAVLGVGVEYGNWWCLVLLIGFAVGLWVSKVSNPLYWIEIAAFILIILGVIV